VGRLRSGGERRQLHLDRVGIRKPDVHFQHLADNQFPLWQHADAAGELGDADLSSRSLS